MGRKSKGVGGYVPNNIRQLREKLGMTATELALLSGVSVSQISKFELQKRKVTLDVAEKLARPLKSTRSEVAGNQLSGTMTIVVSCNVMAGSWLSSLEWEPEDRYEVTVPETHRYPGVERHASEVLGHAMNRVYPDGSVVVWVKYEDTDEPLNTGSHYIIVRKNNDGLLEQSVRSFTKDHLGNEYFVSETTEKGLEESIPYNDAARLAGMFVSGRVTTSIIER